VAVGGDSATLAYAPTDASRTSLGSDSRHRRPTLIKNALLFLTAEENGQWRIASLVGDSVPTPGLPPTWNEGWKYVDRKRRELRV